MDNETIAINLMYAVNTLTNIKDNLSSLTPQEIIGASTNYTIAETMKRIDVVCDELTNNSNGLKY